MRVLQAREDLALDEEAPVRVGVHPSQGKELDGDALLELAVRALGEVDGAHAATAEEALEPVGADAPADHVRRPGRLGARRHAAGEVVEVVVRLLRGREERAHLGQRLRVVALAREERVAFVGGELESPGEELLRAAEALGVHQGRSGAARPPFISRKSHALAVLQSRFTVARDTPSASAVSSSVRPAKNRHSTTRAWRSL